MTSAKKLQADEIIRYSKFIAGFLTKPFDNTDFCESVTGFFSWYSTLTAQAVDAQEQGVPPDLCYRWVILNRQIRAINQMKEVVSSRCISEDFSTEEECLEYKMNQVNQMLSHKILDHNELCMQSPVFSSPWYYPINIPQDRTA